MSSSPCAARISVRAVGLDAILELERRLPMVECRGGRAERGGRERGLDRRPVGLGRPVGRLPVPGRLSGHPADAIGRHRPSLERRRDASVQVPPLARRQVLDDRLGEQPVPEAVAGLVGDEHLAVDRLPDRGQVVALPSPEDRREQRFVERAANDRSRAQGVRARIRQRPHLGQEHLREQVRQRRGAGAGRRDELLGEQGVAARSLVDASGELAIGGRPEDRLDLHRRLIRRQRLQREHRGAGVAAQLGDPADERVASREVLRSERQDQEDALVPEVVEEERDQVARRRIGRLDILEHDGRRPLDAHSAQRVEQLVEQPRLRLTPVEVGIIAGLRVVGDLRGSVARAERGNETSELVPSLAEHGRDPILTHRPDEIAQDRRHRPEREIPGRELEAVADEHAHVPRPSLVPELGDEAGLADAGHAENHDDRRVPVSRAGERIGQGRQLLRTPDKLGTRHPGAHARSMQRQSVGATRGRCNRARDSRTAVAENAGASATGTAT